MRTKIYSVLLNIVISLLFIFLFNIVFSNLNLYIGINPISVGIISVLGIPGIIPLIIAAVIF